MKGDVRPVERLALENTKEGIVERIDPFNVPPGILNIHAARYHFALPHCAGKRVADIACGAGYGSAILARAAESIVGGDADPTAIEFARSHYTSANLSFTVIDAQAMALPPSAADVVVSFETIEHLPRIDLFLAECVRVLRPGGKFIVSTPLVPETNRRPMNPHHTIEFSLADFRSLLSEYFADLELYGQARVQSDAHRVLQRLDIFGLRHKVPSFLRRGATRALATVPFEDMGLESQVIRRDDFRNAHDVVAVCTARGKGA